MSVEIMLEARRLSDTVWVKKVIDYVVNRQNDDGGYTFCQGTESSAQDTYYGLAILNLLDVKFPNVEKTVRFLNELNLDTVYSDYYIAKSLLMCNEKINAKLTAQITSRLSSQGYYGSVSIFSEVASEFITTLMSIELAGIVKVNVHSQEIINWLLQFRNNDGCFGTHGLSNINSTYYAVASLSLLKHDLNDMQKTVGFVRSCEKPYGGFTVTPINTMPYMEHTFYGVMTLDLLGQKALYPSQTIGYVLSCQNFRGGFARSDMGIASFVDTYYAVEILQKLINNKM
ncbi:MAG: hypothetical protein NWE98_08270 [Candidatus Bathyarchaeota archaeon]|nr:hypothetical protein [Candidatus Bathyarchaeota archaeon]